MSNKAKGSRVERELLNLFTERGWKAARVAGSGTNENTFCDLIAGKKDVTGDDRKGYAIEIKSSKKDRIYITKRQIEDFIVFSDIMGLKAIIAVRFNREGWIFLNPGDMEDSGKYWVVSLKRAKEKGHKFAQFFD
ncbi:nucleoid-structuring protein H-NS [Candidatus Pacearchaeota archaeon CG_4_9_14_0_2_um_filter_39_13]|nr:nucleoid-structuring protein H-NS [Candidatus Pacearchaeota archaeon]PJC44663.1 MAG: nucleoid-structuring protein H-NS [Candidatus Pacearchaeota archaeon CG_4_9_14_0_2_um_filter_39_13]